MAKKNRVIDTKTENFDKLGEVTYRIREDEEGRRYKTYEFSSAALGYLDVIEIKFEQGRNPYFKIWQKVQNKIREICATNKSFFTSVV